MPFQLHSDYKPTGDQPQAIEKLISGIKKGHRNQVLLGVTGSGKTFTIANVIQAVGKPTLIISHNKTLAAQLYQEFKEFFPYNAVHYFVSYYDYYQPEAYIPQRDLYIEKDADINEEIDKLRLASTNSLLTRDDVIVIASVSAIYNIGSPINYRRAMKIFEVGKISFKKAQSDLIDLFYERNDYDFKRGTFRNRTNCLDVNLSYTDLGLKLIFQGNSLTDIKIFNPVDGSPVANLDSHIELILAKEGDRITKVAVYPAKHYITDQTKIEQKLKKIESDMQSRVKELKREGKHLEAHRLGQKVKYDLEMIKELGYCKGIENYSIYFDDRKIGDPPYSLLDYFPKDYLLILDESHITVPQIRGMSEGDLSRKQTLIDYGFRLPTAMQNRPLNFSEFEDRMGYTIFMSATPEEYEITKSKGNVVEQVIRPTGLVDPKIEVRTAQTQIEDLIKEIEITVKKGNRTLVTTLTKRMAEELSTYLKGKNIKVTYLHSDIDTLERTDILTNLRDGTFDVLVGINLLREGLDLPEVALVAILDADKEGFLRSHTSLIQTMGRAARHVEGRVILYADNITKSMKAAIKEVERRRKIQLKYNEDNGIIPQSIQKSIRTRIMPKIEEEQANDRIKKVEQKIGKDIEVMTASYHVLSKTEQKKILKWLKEEMQREAEKMNFERAIELRDLVRQLTK